MQRTYTLEELAKFLRRPAKELEKLADKGLLVGRKQQGSWVFALPDVVGWLETELAQSPGEEPGKAELAIADEIEDEERPLSELLAADVVDLSFGAKTQDSVLREMTKLAVDAGKIWDGDALLEALREREKMASTALENGVAILHPRRPQENNMPEDFLALGVARRGVPFGGGFNNLTDVFFLLCCQTDAAYLRTLGRLARVLKRPGFLDALRECASPDDVRDLFDDAETDADDEEQ